MKINNFQFRESYMLRGIETSWGRYFNMWSNSRVSYMSGSSRYNKVSGISRYMNMSGSSSINDILTEQLNLNGLLSVMV